MSAERLRALATVAFAAALTLVWAEAAEAYVRKQTNDGAPVRWQEGPVALHIAQTHACGPSRDEIDRALEIAVEAWRIDTSVPDVIVRAGSPPGRYGYFAPYERGNGVYVLCDDWPFDDRLAVTVATHDVTGRMLDADIVIDGRAGLALIEDSTGDNSYDLASVLTHEVGHVLGLGESMRRNATMWPTTARGDTRKRTLSGDDENGILAHYEGANISLESYGCSTGGAPSASSARPVTPPLAAAAWFMLAASRLRRRGSSSG